MRGRESGKNKWGKKKKKEENMGEKRQKEEKRSKMGKKCRNPGSNQGPLDLQSNALPTELFRLPH